MESDGSKDEEKESRDITIFYSQELNIHLILRPKEINPIGQQSDSEEHDSDKAMKFFPTEFVGWEEGDMPYGILMDTLEIEWEIEAEEEKREAQEESLIRKNF